MGRDVSRASVLGLPIKLAWLLAPSGLPSLKLGATYVKPSFAGVLSEEVVQWLERVT